jgi:hypothetical protein
MPFQIKAVNDEVVVVTFYETLSSLEIQAYKKAYKDMYHSRRRFVLVFDTRQLSMPTPELFQTKVDLIFNFKHHSLAQVIGAVILTDYDFIKHLVMQISKAGGQAAPLAVVTTVQECAHLTADWLELIHGRTPAAIAACRPLFSKTEPAAVMALLVCKFIMFMRHFIRFRFTKLTA